MTSKPEFRPVLFPVFCHFYLDLVQLGLKDMGKLSPEFLEGLIHEINSATFLLDLLSTNDYRSFSSAAPSIHHPPPFARGNGSLGPEIPC